MNYYFDFAMCLCAVDVCSRSVLETRGSRAARRNRLDRKRRFTSVGPTKHDITSRDCLRAITDATRMTDRSARGLVPFICPR